ncbi:MAG: hypothetical protein RO257_04170 [Candidatus Kapabacteria bacterium]|nr:hypothetical protein [Candidatus Kapabacteria bacterium]
MKRLPILTIVFICLIYSSVFSINSDIDSNTVSVDDIPSKKFDLILIGGAGITTGFHSYDDFFKSGPILNFGLEIPFSKSHIFAVEFMAHSWIARQTEESKKNDFIIIKDYYYQVNNDYWSQSGLSVALKCYFLTIIERLRLSIELGVLLLSPNDNYFSHNSGFGIYYLLNEKYSISLNRKFYFKLGGEFKNQSHVPNSIMFNLNYKL